MSNVDREAFIIETYRAGRISLGKVAELLSLATSIEAGEWLGARGVARNYSLEDLNADRRKLDKVFDKGR